MKKINNSAIGDSWEDVKKELFTPEEIIEIETSAALMGELIEARHKKGISQKHFLIVADYAKKSDRRGYGVKLNLFDGSAVDNFIF